MHQFLCVEDLQLVNRKKRRHGTILAECRSMVLYLPKVLQEQKATSLDAAFLSIQTTTSRHRPDERGLLADFTWVIADD